MFLATAYWLEFGYASFSIFLSLAPPLLSSSMYCVLFLIIDGSFFRNIFQSKLFRKKIKEFYVLMINSEKKQKKINF